MEGGGGCFLWIVMEFCLFVCLWMVVCLVVLVLKIWLAGIFYPPLMEGGSGCFLRIVMEHVSRAEDCDGKQGKSAPRRQDIHVASPLQEFDKNLSQIQEKLEIENNLFSINTYL